MGQKSVPVDLDELESGSKDCCILHSFYYLREGKPKISPVKWLIVRRKVGMETQRVYGYYRSVFQAITLSKTMIRVDSGTKLPLGEAEQKGDIGESPQHLTSLPLLFLQHEPQTNFDIFSFSIRDL